MEQEIIDDEKESAEEEDREIVAEARKRLNISLTFEQLFRQEAIEDLRFRAGDQWPEKIMRDRELRGQPTLKFNLIPKFIRQVTGDARQNIPGVNVVPVNYKANHDTASVLKGMLRYIEYISTASYVYIKGLDQSATTGRGWWQVCTDYTDDESFDQDILIKPIQNCLAVYVDPAATGPVYRDSEWYIVREWVNKEAFSREYPDVEVTDKQDTLDMSIGDNRWYTEEDVAIAYYWRKEYTNKELLHVVMRTPMGQSDFQVFEDDPILDKADFKIIKRRTVKKIQVVCYKITGENVLEKKEWQGKFIPIVPVLGEEVNIDGKDYLSGIVRYAKDPQRNYNYWMTMATELISLAPKIPWVVTDAMIENYRNEWDQANDSNFAYLRYTPDPLAPAAKPERQQVPQMSPGHWQMLQQSENGLYGTTGIFKPSLGQESNEQSGRAIMARQREGDVGTYVYLDNWMHSITFTGEIIVDLIPRIYDTDRVVMIINEKDEMEMVPVNGAQPPSTTPEQKVAKIYDLNEGKYGVRLTTGPSYLTKRQEAANSMLEFLRIYPSAAPVLGDLLATAMDWEGSQEIGDRLKQLAQKQGLIPPGPGNENPQTPQQPGQTVAQPPAESGIPATEQVPGTPNLGPKPVV